MMWRWLKNNHQAMTGVGAMLVGVAALYVAWDQGRVMREQQHGAVYPVLQIDGFVSLDGDIRRLGVLVKNAGVGPALIDNIVLFRNGEASGDFSGLMARMPEQAGLNWSTMIGRVLVAGGEVTPMEFIWPDGAMSSADYDALLAEWSQWDMTACYCSVFGRCWIADTTGVGRRPQPVEQCSIPDEDVFEQLAEAQNLNGSE